MLHYPECDKLNFTKMKIKTIYYLAIQLKHSLYIHIL